MVLVSHSELIIYMMTKLKSLVTQLILLTFALWFGYYCVKDDSYSYDLISYRKDDVHFIKNGSRIIPSTVIDHVWVEGFLIGLRLHVDYLKCESKHGGVNYKMRVNNDQLFFIVDLDNDTYLEFNEKKSFKDKLTKLGIEKKVILNYLLFEIVYAELSTYHNYDKDFENCLVLDNP